ncbi:MAG: hypothetical protein JXR53_09755 [Bacteroidales bacterium]|nr:hypothetical protein [Bacteroidales bacterium]
MQKIIFLILFFSACTFVSAQSEVESKVSEAYGSEYLTSLKEKNPDLLNYYSFVLTESYEIVFYGQEKSQQNGIKELTMRQNTGQITKKENIEDLNILLYDYSIDETKKSVYRIDDSGWVIVFHSKNTLDKMYSSFTQNLK